MKPETDRRLDNSTHGGEATGGRVALCPLVRESSESGPFGLPSLPMGRLRPRTDGAGPRSQSSGGGAKAQTGSPTCSAGLQAQIMGCLTHGAWLAASPRTG